MVTRAAVGDADWTGRITAVSGAPNIRGVVYFADSAVDSGGRDGAVCASVAEPFRLLRSLPSATVPLLLVTTGAQSVSAEDATTDPFAAAIWGFGRVISAERPESPCQLIDLDPAAHGDPEQVAALLAECTHQGLDEVAFRGGIRYVRGLERAGERSPAHHVHTRTDRIPVRLRDQVSGLAELGWAATTRRAPGPTEIEIEVAYVGVNFKDVLKVTGLLSPEVMAGSHSGSTLGLECSGTVVRVGAAVSEFRPGDEVFAHSRALFASHVTVDVVRVARKPESLSLAQAAALVPQVTAYLSLVRLARLQRGERVLIHSAAGGVGLAAVRLATWLGAVVYATAGTEQRRAFLRGEGVAAVADSTSTTFADDILEWTGGAGVDVVLNSLPGEMLHRSIGLLGPFGRFVELGKADIAADRALRLAPFHRALSFHAFDYDQMMLLEPGRVRAAMVEVAGLHDTGMFAPLPVTEIPAEEVADAFRMMTRREHIGKVVVRMAGEPVAVPASSVPGSPVRPDATYVITGGLGGLGRTVARWLVDRGARHLVLVGLHGMATEEAARAVADLSAQGAEVRVLQADVADRGQVRDLLARTRAELPAIRGIVHAAANFDDAVLADTDPARLIAATRPKADGAWHLHCETQADDLDFYILFSSLAAQLGAVAAGAYATANEFLNALARYRRARGLPATSVGWGMIDEVGVAVSRGGAVGAVLRRNGHVGMPAARFAAELETLVRTRPVEVLVADIDWRHWARANPQLAGLPRFRSLIPADAGDGDGDDQASPWDRLREATPEQRRDMLPPLVAPLLQRVTDLSDQQLDAQQAVDIDSLAAVELRVLIQRTLGVSVSAVRLQRNLTVTSLASLLAEELDRAPAPGAQPPPEGLVPHEFASSDGLTIYGHLSLPPGPGPHPAVVVCTSGVGGALDDEGRYVRVGEHAPLRAAGFAVFTVDQRGTPGHGADYGARVEMGGSDIDDLLAAARYLAGFPDIDPARLSILGTSRGAASALLALARDPAPWHRAALLMGPYDPALLVEAERVRPGTLLPADTKVNWGALGEYFADLDGHPIRRLEAVRTPLLVVHGEDDEMIPVAQAVHLVDRAYELGLPARLITVPGLGHDNEHTTESWAELWPQITGFLGEDAV